LCGKEFEYDEKRFWDHPDGSRDDHGIWHCTQCEINFLRRQIEDGERVINKYRMRLESVMREAEG
jgi:ribosomal protein L37AE/L43A